MKLKEGDIIEVSNPLRAKKDSFFRVNRVEGNRAFTKFRVFNTRIYYHTAVYEYGKRVSPYDNGYHLVTEEEAKGFEIN